ncbi:hypothetical protein LSTR_LSTR011512 [Laodelphax striatellus]|uniref:DUF19 domain-containing protein n=1 Tax=Laodelphax striatellus TaxID=195883 RepID=A0A482WFX3_LAOST|nr:hypothetical protein LSTR_LSTR011512 [Laodelphax striatellus]
MSPLCNTLPSLPQMKTILTVFALLFSGVTWSTASEASGEFPAAPQNEECSQEMLVRCALPLKVLSDNSQDLSFAAKREDLEELCPNLEQGLKCIEDYTRNCLELHQRQHFNLLYSDTSIVIQEICQKGPYQEEFLRHAPCMREVKDEYELCTRNYQTKIQEMTRQSNNHPGEDNDKNIKKLCCSFQEYLSCSREIMLDKCGEGTATFTAGLLRRMSISLIKLHCEKYQNNENVCRQNGAPSFSVPNVWILLVSLFLVHRITMFSRL